MGRSCAGSNENKRPCSSTTHRKGGDYIMLDLPAHETLTGERRQGRDGAREALTLRACYLRTLCRDVRKGIHQLLPPCFVAAKLFESTQRRDLRFSTFSDSTALLAPFVHLWRWRGARALARLFGRSDGKTVAKWSTTTAGSSSKRLVC